MPKFSQRFTLSFVLLFLGYCWFFQKLQLPHPAPQAGNLEASFSSVPLILDLSFPFSLPIPSFIASGLNCCNRVLRLLSPCLCMAWNTLFQCELKSKFKYHLCGASLTSRIRPFPADLNLYPKITEGTIQGSGVWAEAIIMLNFVKALSRSLSDRIR